MDRLRGLAETTSDAVGSSAFDPRESLQLGGGLTITIPPHFGHARICPIAAWSRTFSRDLQVVQVMENKSMVISSAHNTAGNVYFFAAAAVARSNQNNLLCPHFRDPGRSPRSASDRPPTDPSPW